MRNGEDAIDNYILWELCKQEEIQKLIVDGSDQEELKEIIETARYKYREKDYSLDEKKEKLKQLDSNPDYRIKIFESCNWKKKTAKIENLGTTLPRFGGLPPEVITGSVTEVVDFVRKADPEKYQSVKYIHNLKKFPEVLNEFHPWVITPRNRPSKIDRMNKVHGKQEWNIKDTWGMINDGNHRTIAKILANNSEEIECYVGHRKQ